MQPRPLFTWNDFFRSVAIGVLLGWLLIAIHDPEHPRFDFKITSAPLRNLLVG